jgi:glutamate dehydrogenase
MITTDRAKREAKQARLLELLSEKASPEDRELLLSFAPVVFAETPDRIALNIFPEALAERIYRHFRFVAREIPPAPQLYRGVPGIHVSVYNPNEADATAMSEGGDLPGETTVVETHTVDAPFIFDSLKNYFSRAGLQVFSAIHPIFTVRRQWERVVWFGGPHDDGSKEVYCHFQIEPVDSKERLRRMEHEIFSVLKCVFLAVEDFRRMLKVVPETAARLRSRRGDEKELASARAFLNWLLDENYIFLGAARYLPGPNGTCERVQDSVQGVFSDSDVLPVVFPGLIEELESRIVPGANDDSLIGLDYCRNASAIYHLEPIDSICLREWGPDGSLRGATLLLGRFARGTFVQRADRIPLLQEKIELILSESNALPNSHLYREIRNIFSRLPMRELFYAPPASLKTIIEPIVFMMGDDEIAVQCRKGSGYVALSIAFSRLRYSYIVEQSLTRALTEEFGPVSFHTAAECGAVSLILFYFDADRLEHPVEAETVRRIARPLVTTWEAQVAQALENAFGEREGRRLFRKYVRIDTRSGLYREVTLPDQVPDDVRHLENLESRLEVQIVPKSAETSALRLYSMRALGLTETLRTLQNLGIQVTDEMRIPLVLPSGGRRCYLYRLEVSADADCISELHTDGERFIDALRAVDEERLTNDRLNGLILQAGLTWRQVELLRTLRNHLLQIRTHYNVETVNGVLLRNHAVAGALFSYFRARLDPTVADDRSSAMATAESAVQEALESVSSLAEDEVLRALFNLVRSSLRTNFFQVPERPVFSVKIDSRKVEGMPSPKPMFEIYVHSRLLEGVHLRGGKVARGGIRWSDRHDDFRTEILGLMKTQMVKNSIIVPVGSKGGFVLKGSLPARPALDAYLIDRYREFVSGLLDVTDNIVDGKVIYPPEVVRHDGDDPYLVVAADKGTAHLSDTANSVSMQYGFWLGDAFASGGSVGYDHKQVGITARGTWECVKHHFRNLGVDIQKEPFTVAGIGDMAGDVFGNGMLQSRAMRLVAAFNHAHIFVDPDPDQEKSFKERERMFRLPQSTWRDYDSSAISRGGGIFDRSAKAISVTPEMRRLLDIEEESVSGEGLIRCILRARVDLLYNGGIGTYVKASSEDDADVGDRANDRVRINGCDLRCRVIGEGGNLGLTQRARLEFWSGGGLLNTDALDNSAGVDMSDHEVNIKILLDMLFKRGVIKGKKERNRILAEMTEEVAELVLADNENQSRALSLDGMRSAASYEEFVALVEDMVLSGIVNRVDEDIPTRETLLGSPLRDRGLPRPLLAKLLGYCKMWAYDQVLQAPLTESDSAMSFLEGYFPKRLRESFAEHFREHALTREIVATVVVNYLVNNGGIGLIRRLMSPTRKGLGDAFAAWIDADRKFDGPVLRNQVRAANLDARSELESLLEIEQAIELAARSLLEEGEHTEAAAALASLQSRLRR